jgi:hypothetical protein
MKKKFEDLNVNKKNHGHCKIEGKVLFHSYTFIFLRFCNFKFEPKVHFFYILIFISEKIEIFFTKTPHYKHI